MKKTLILLSLTIGPILLTPPSYAFWEWGKYPSRIDAKEACNKWVEKGPFETYKASVYLSKEEQEKRIEPLRKERDKKDEEIKKESIGEKKVKKEFGAGYYYPSRYAYAFNNAYFETQVAIVMTTTKVEERERPIRKCHEEYKTNQFIGMDENKKTYYRY